VIDVGRATRTISPALWKALVARDQHCTHPGCTRAPAYCEGHHIIHWSQGGATCLANLKLLCWEHHRKQHLLDAPQRE
jgi:5-methylcytosine-specific restriction endonuclease McrA